MTLASWFNHGLGFWDDRKCWVFFSTQAVLSKVWNPKFRFSRDPPSRWEPKWDPYHSHTNRRDSKMGVKLQLQKVFGSWRKRMLWVLGDTAPFFKKELMKGGNQRTKWNAGGDMFLVSEYQLHLRNSFVLQDCWRQHPGVIKLPILGGSNLVQMYGNSQGFPLSQVHCLGWCHIKKRPVSNFAIRRRYCKESQACIKEFDHFCGCAWLPTMPYPPRTAEVDVLVMRDGKTCSVRVRSCEYW